MRNWLFKLLFAAEYRLLQQLAAAHARRLLKPARFKLEGGMPEEQVARRLAGSQEAPLMQAVMALIDTKIIEMCDRATNPPSEVNTPDLRTYESGGANAIAELKSKLQELTAADAEEETKA